VTYEFAATPLADALYYLCEQSNTSLVGPPRAYRETVVTGRGERQAFASALRRVLKTTDLDFAVIHGTVLVSTRADLFQARGSFRDLRADYAELFRLSPLLGKELSKRVTADLGPCDPDQSFAFMASKSKASMLTPAVAGGVRSGLSSREASPGNLNVRFSQSPFIDAVFWLARTYGLEVTWHRSAVFVTQPRNAEVIRRFGFLPEDDLRVAKESFAVPPFGKLADMCQRRISLKACPPSLGEVCKGVASKGSSGLVVRAHPDVSDLKVPDRCSGMRFGRLLGCLMNCPAVLGGAWSSPGRGVHIEVTLENSLDGPILQVRKKR